MPAVLVVDDEPAIVDLICDILTDADVVAEGCTRPEHARGVIHRLQPQLVILDVQMPGLDGIHPFRELKSDPDTSEIPIIFCTANPEALRQQIPDYQLFGADLLPKPFHLHTLRSMVEQTVFAAQRERGMMVAQEHAFAA